MGNMHLKIIVAFIFFETIGNIQSQGLPDCGVRSENFSPRKTRIIGGKIVPIGQYPWVIALLRTPDCISFKQICGGTIISEHWIVTAAHCVCHRVPHVYHILAGINDLYQLNVPSKRTYQVSEIFVHPKYEATRKDDIALLRTLTPIDISISKIYINRICLPSITESSGQNVVVAGWGRVSNSSYSNRLKKVRLHVIENSMCNQIYDWNPYDDIDTIHENIICAARQEVGSCEGDSGGPLMKKNKSGVYTLIGVVSYGYPDCAGELGQAPYVTPSVYTRASKYIPWIKRIMEQPDGVQSEFNKTFNACYDFEQLNCSPRSFE